MSDILIRDVPDDVLAAVESHAATLGLFRNETSRGHHRAPSVPDLMIAAVTHQPTERLRLA